MYCLESRLKYEEDIRIKEFTLIQNHINKLIYSLEEEEREKINKSSDIFYKSKPHVEKLKNLMSNFDHKNSGFEISNSYITDFSRDIGSVSTLRREATAPIQDKFTERLRHLRTTM